MRDFLIQSCLLKNPPLPPSLWKIFISNSFKKDPLETEPTKLNILLQVFIWDHLPKSRLGKHHLSATVSDLSSREQVLQFRQWKTPCIKSSLKTSCCKLFYEKLDDLSNFGSHKKILPVSRLSMEDTQTRRSPDRKKFPQAKNCLWKFLWFLRLVNNGFIYGNLSATGSSLKEYLLELAINAT